MTSRDEQVKELAALLNEFILFEYTDAHQVNDEGEYQTEQIQVRLGDWLNSQKEIPYFILPLAEAILDAGYGKKEEK